MRLAALYTATLAILCAYAIHLVLVSRDLMIADFMTYRGISMMIARLVDAGEWPLLASAATQSITQDYAWGPALAPGLALALTQPTSRAVYTFALLALYAAPALLALAILARDLARRAGLRRLPSSQPSPVDGRGGDSLLPFTREGGPKGRMRELEEGSLPLAVAAAFFAYPAAMAVAARGMPDVGELVLTVCALRLAERLARLLALGQGHDARIAPMTRRVALALALTLFAMFAFRRWYALAAAGIAIMLAIEVGSVAFSRRARFRWKDAAAAGALGLLTLLALSSPVIVDWLPNLGAHDYARSYAAYRKPPDVFLHQLGDWVGLLPALAALGGAALLWTRSADRRLLRLTLGSAAIAAALFLRIQTPYIHHLYLIAPAIAAPVAASLMLAFASRPRAALAALAALGAITLSPLAAALNPLALAPIAGLPRAPRADLDELERLKGWVDQRARPDARVCGLGSELHVQRSADWRIVAIASGAGDALPAEDGCQDARRRCGRWTALGRPEGLRHHHRRRSGPDPPQSRRSADGCPAVAGDADRAGDRGEVPPHRRGVPSGKWRQRDRVRAPGPARRRRHRRAPVALARGSRRARIDDAVRKPTDDRGGSFYRRPSHSYVNARVRNSRERFGLFSR